MIAWAAALRVQAGLVDLSDVQEASFAVRPRWDLQDVCVPAA
jgi:N6-L-threonylcarbamoyladenine synthase